MISILSVAKICLLLFIGLSFLKFEVKSQTIILTDLKSFPSAEGYGKYSCVSQPARSVYYVTNLNDSGPGSFRDAVSQSNRLVLFKVAGTITLSSQIDAVGDNIYIAGQTAYYDGGEGITVKADGTYGSGLFSFSGDHTVMRYLRLRRGPGVSGGEVSGDNVNFFADYWMVDHCSISWSTDENLSSSNGEKGTMQYSISSEGLYFSTHTYSRDPNHGTYQTGHSKGGIFGYTNNYVNEVSFYKNLFAHNDGRNPLIVGPGGRFEIVNNLLYNNRYFNISLAANSSTVGLDMETNVVKNLLIAGSDTRTVRHMVHVDETVNDKVYMQGNIGVHRTNDTQSEWLELGQYGNPIGQTGRAFSSFVTPLQSKFNLLDDAVGLQAIVLNDVGANIVEDAVDTRIKNDVINLTPTVSKTVQGTSAQWTGQSTYYGIINDPSEVGGWPVIGGMNSVVPDANNDGIDDTWAATHNVSSWSQIKTNYTINGINIVNNAGYTARQIYLAYMANDFSRLDTTNTTSVIENNDQENDLKLFPNPVKDILHWDVLKENVLACEVYDIYGKQIIGVLNINSRINVSSLAPGNYFIKIKTVNKTFIQSFIKQ